MHYVIKKYHKGVSPLLLQNLYRSLIDNSLHLIVETLLHVLRNTSLHNIDQYWFVKIT